MSTRCSTSTCTARSARFVVPIDSATTVTNVRFHAPGLARRVLRQRRVVLGIDVRLSWSGSLVFEMDHGQQPGAAGERCTTPLRRQRPAGRRPVRSIGTTARCDPHPRIVRAGRARRLKRRHRRTANGAPRSAARRCRVTRTRTASFPSHSRRSATARIRSSGAAGVVIPSERAPTLGTIPDFTPFEEQVRFVNMLGDGVCPDSAVLLTSFRCAQLGCTPEYRDWAGELAGRTLHVVGREIVPSSEYAVTNWPRRGRKRKHLLVCLHRTDRPNNHLGQCGQRPAAQRPRPRGDGR